MNSQRNCPSILKRFVLIMRGFLTVEVETCQQKIIEVVSIAEDL
jgi:hypothetical protein